MRKAPAIPANVFLQTEDTPVAPERGTEKTYPVKPAKGYERKPLRRQTVKRADSPKVQVTVYLSEEGERELERIRFDLLNEHGLKASRSAIVEHALRKVASDRRALANALRGEK